MTFGWLLGEAVRRSDPKNRPFERFVREEVCSPLGMSSFWLGLPADRQHCVAELSWPGQTRLPDGSSLSGRAVPPSVALIPDVFNRSDVRAGCLPAVGGVSDARSAAALFSMLANEGRLADDRFLATERIASFLEPRQQQTNPTTFMAFHSRLVWVAIG